MLKICQFCETQVEVANGRIFSNHVKWCKKNPSAPKYVPCEFCSKSVNSLLMYKHLTSCPRKPGQERRCPTCNTIVLNTENSFCGSSCAAKFNNVGKEHREKGYKFSLRELICNQCGSTFLWPNNAIVTDECDNCSKIIQGNCKKSKKEEDYSCIMCEKVFQRYVWMKRVTCSENCNRELLSKRSRENPNCGGETNFYKYTYANIVMDSSWEVKIAKFLDESKITWVRSRKINFEWIDEQNKTRRYYPDFYLPDYNLYLDPKNKWKLELDRDKLQRVVEKNKIKLVAGHVDVMIETLKKLFNQQLDLNTVSLLVI